MTEERVPTPDGSPTTSHAHPGWFEVSCRCEQDEGWELAEAMSRLGAEGVTLLPEGESAPQLEPEPGSTPLWSRVIVVGLFASQAEARMAMESLSAQDRSPVLSLRAEQDWVAAGRAGFAPRRFGERLWVLPPWSSPPDPMAANVVIAPGLAFGTGSHPSTALCLEWLAQHPPQGDSVLDYGTGSGILALAAARLGAATVVAVDNDPQALAAVQSNARLNERTIASYLPEDLPKVRVDLLIANILARPLVSLAPHLLSCVREGGTLLLAGVTTEQVEVVASAYAGAARLVGSAEERPWARLELRRRADERRTG